MSQPIRVEELAYPRGARVSLRLRFRSQNHVVRRRGTGITPGPIYCNPIASEHSP
jgi:hypothetical protein